MNRVTSCLVALAAGLTLASLLSDTAEARRTYYGAIYFSPTTRATGYVGNASSRQEAVDTAYAYCNADDCIKGIEFWGGSCGAVAVGSRGGWGSSWGEEIEFAADGAVRACSEHDRGCRVIKYLCSAN